MHELTDSEYAVSVVMPVHNAGQHLAPAVNSILNQVGIQFELIIVDDHSNDDAINNLNEDHRVKIVKSPGKGIVTALNYGINMASYSFVARMDADDVALKTRLLDQLTHFKTNTDLDICGTKVQMFNDESTIGQGYQHYQNWINNLCSGAEIEREFFIESPIPHPSAMFRKDFIISLGRYRECEWPEDYDLWFRALLVGANFGKPAGKPLLKWRDHPNRLSRTDHRYSKQMFLQCKAYYLSKFLRLRDITNCMILGSGPTGLKIHDYLFKSGIQVEAFIDINKHLQGRYRRNKPIYISSENESQSIIKEFANLNNSIIITAVSARGRHEQIRNYLTALGLIESDNYIIAA